MTPSLDNLLVVMAVAFAAPLVLGLFPRLQLPSVVLEIVAGIVIGPAVLAWVEVDEAVEVVALIGLAFVLFLAGLEIEFEKLRGPLLRLTAAGFALSFAIANAVSQLLSAGGSSTRPCWWRSSCARPRWACWCRCSRTPARSPRRSVS
jgi:Kef-type K+ transport system membrane component KefB